VQIVVSLLVALSRGVAIMLMVALLLIEHRKIGMALGIARGDLAVDNDRLGRECEHRLFDRLETLGEVGAIWKRW
jgi:hypothetical protein